MKYEKTGNHYVLRLEKGEEIIQKLEEFCGKEKISSGHFQGIGGLEKAEISYYDTGDREYHPKVFDEPPMELLSLLGNVSISGGNLKVHAHVIIGLPDFSTVGGHLNKGEVLPTCEIIFIPFEGKVERKMDEGTGLALLDV